MRKRIARWLHRSADFFDPFQHNEPCYVLAPHGDYKECPLWKLNEARRKA